MCFIKIQNRVAKIIKIYDHYIWQLQFLDDKTYINVFYAREEDWACA